MLRIKGDLWRGQETERVEGGGWNILKYYFLATFPSTLFSSTPKSLYQNIE